MVTLQILEIARGLAMSIIEFWNGKINNNLNFKRRLWWVV